MKTKQMLCPEGHLTEHIGSACLYSGGFKLLFKCEVCDEIFHDDQCTAREVEGE